MSDRRTVLHERFKQYLPVNSMFANLVAVAGRFVSAGRKHESLAHLAPISLTPIQSTDLPAANRNSA